MQQKYSPPMIGSSTIPKPVKLSLVIPALNEQDSITRIMDRVLSTQSGLSKAGVDELELIVVDDGSTDQTAEMVKSYPHVRLIQHAHNKGYGAALKSGFHCASGQLLGFLDADGTYPPEHLPQLCQAVLDGADVVVGSRRSGAASEMPPIRKLGNFIWSNLLTLVAGQRVIDPASGMRVFRREMLDYIYPLPDGLNFTPVMSTRTAHEHLRVVELPIPYKERQGSSKLSVVRDGIRFLQTILWTALNYNPVRILGGVGAVLIGIALLIALALVALRISGVTVLGPWGVAGTFTAVVLSIAGVNLFALGITFNYLVSLFHKRPIHQGLFRRPIFKTPLDRHFWWMGFVLMAGGLILGMVSFALALSAWPVERLWLYLLAGTLFILVGFQLDIFWLIVRILDELSQRESHVQNDMDAG
jgi:glycosyltransferase involved in cell wall biosynthesis